MLKALARTCAFAGCLGLMALPLAAQEVVHALTGTVSSISPATKTITVFQDNGSQAIFQMMQNLKKVSIAFDKKILAGTTAANAFDQKDAYVIVFFYGGGDDRTAVALKSLGKGPFTATVGTVEKVERGHFITVKDDSGTVHAFTIDSSTVAEGMMGVEEGIKFQADKGDRVRVVSSTEKGSPTALFVRAM
jgi:hypothetical protein